MTTRFKDDWRDGRILPESGPRSSTDLRIALVNNMPDAALAAAERQFAGLIEASRGELTVSVSLYALSRIPRSAETRVAMAARYGGLDDLVASPPDMLIVTGAEPRAPRLSDEPYWSELCELVAWAQSGAVAATLYSCLAAHAAVQIADGVERRRLPAKLSGVFAADVEQHHELSEGLAAPLTPHSRYNDLDAQDLADCGYIVLTRSARAGVDAFVKERASLELFWQGHPEYEANTLANELRRDLKRFADGALRAPPSTPENYLPPETQARLDAYIAGLEKGRGVETPASPFADLAPLAAPWAESARQSMRTFLGAAFRRTLSRHAVDVAERAAPSASPVGDVSRL